MNENETLCDALERVQKSWDLSTEKMAAIAHVDLETYIQRMKEHRSDPSAPTIPKGMDSAVPVVSIYKALERRFPDSQEDRVKWLFTKHKDFGDNRPIDVVTSSVGNLFWVSYYLNSSD